MVAEGSEMNQLQHFAKDLGATALQIFTVLAIGGVVFGGGYWLVWLLPSRVQNFLGQCFSVLAVIVIGGRIVYIVYEELGKKWDDAKRAAWKDERKDRDGNQGRSTHNDSA